MGAKIVPMTEKLQAAVKTLRSEASGQKPAVYDKYVSVIAKIEGVWHNTQDEQVVAEYMQTRLEDSAGMEISAIFARAVELLK